MHTHRILISRDGPGLRTGPVLAHRRSITIPENRTCTRHHVMLTLLFWLIPCTAVRWTDPLVPAVLLAGTVAGSILPDIHMKRPSRLRLLSAAWLLTRAGRRVLIPLICRFYRATAGIPANPCDKRLTHAVPGILLYSTLCAIPALAAVLLFPGSPVTILAASFATGIFLGMSTHLVQDLCTRKGIAPLFPFSSATLAGSIRPCDRCDPRISRFHLQHITALCLLYVAGPAAGVSGPFSPACGCACAAACLALMVWQSGAGICRQEGLLSVVKKDVAEIPAERQ